MHPAALGAPRAAAAPARARARARSRACAVGAGRGAGWGAAGEPGAGRPRSLGKFSKWGVGWAGTPQFGLNSRLGLLSRRSLRSRGRLSGLGLGLHPDPTSGPACASSAPGARPALRPHKLVSLLCWALLELVPLTPRFIFFFNWGFYFAGRARREAAFFLSPARARFPAPRRAWVPPLAGSGAGCTLVAVHAVGGHRFPAPAPAACAPPPARSGPSSLRPTCNGRAQTLAESPRARVWSRGDRGFTSPQAGKETGGREGSPGTHSN